MSLYDLIPLPHDIVYIILEVGSLTETACVKCKKFHTLFICPNCKKEWCTLNDKLWCLFLDLCPGEE